MLTPLCSITASIKYLELHPKVEIVSILFLKVAYLKPKTALQNGTENTCCWRTKVSGGFNQISTDDIKEVKEHEE